MKTQSKLRKKGFTIVEQACHQVRGFRKLYEELDDKVRLSGHSSGTLKNYARKMAQLSLYFGKLPEYIPEKEPNKYPVNKKKNRKPWKEICRDHLKFDPDECPHCKTGRMILLERFTPLRGPPAIFHLKLQMK